MPVIENQSAISQVWSADGMFDTKDITHYLMFAGESISKAVADTEDIDAIKSALFQIEGILKAAAYIHVLHDTIQELHQSKKGGVQC